MIQINPLKSYIDGGVRAAITTPPSASLVFDLPGKAIWVKGVKLKGTDHTYTFSHDNYITLTNTPDSNESEDIKIGVNTSALKNAIDTTYGVVSTTANGLAPKFTSGNKLAASAATTYYFLGWAGSTLKWYQAPFRNIRINSDTTDCLGVNNADPLIISSGNGISITWDSTNKKIIITNTKPDVNHNTDTKVALSVTTLNKNYAVILKGNDSDEGSITTVNFSTYLKFNPSTKLLTINGNKVITTIDTFVGATTSADGSIGLVTKPLIANRLLFLRGDGIWATPTNTWRPVKVEGTEKLGSNALDLSAGNGISIIYNNDTKKIVITNTKPDVNHNTHYTTMLYIGENNDTKANKNVANPYLKLFDDNTRRATFQIKAGNGIAVASDTNGNITITNSSPDVNHNTDYRVTQSETTTANYRPLVVGYTNVNTAGSGMTGSVTNQVYVSNKFYVQPSTGNLYATTFVGALLGNAATSSKWVTARTLNLIGSVTGSASFDGSGNITLATTTNHTHTALMPERFDTNAPAPNSKYGLTFQFSYNLGTDASGWWNVLNMRSYTDDNYTSAQIITPAHNPGKDTGYSGNMKWRQGRNSTWLDWKTIIDSSNYTNYINTTNFPGLNKTGTVTSVTVTGSNGLSGTGTITTSGTITLSNAGVRSATINGNYLRVNTNGTNADLTIPYAINSDKVDEFHAMSAGSLLYKYKVIATIPASSITGDFWYATITFSRNYVYELTKSLIDATYSNIQGLVYLNTYLYTGTWYAFTTSFNGCNIKGIALKSQNNPIYYVKLAKPKLYLNIIPDGKIIVYSPYNCTITVSPTAPSGVTFTNITIPGFTNLKANSAYTADLATTATYTSNVGTAGTVGTNYVTASKVIATCNWYDTMISTDSDNIINRWSEIVAFVANFKETPDLATYLSNNYLAKSGGTMTGPLKWANSATLPELTSPKYFVCIDEFTDGGTTKYASKTNTLKALTGLTSVAIGDSDEPVYWNGTTFVKANAYPTKASWNYDDVYSKKYYYSLPPQKCVKINYSTYAPVIISACRNNVDGLFLLVGLGYGRDGWACNQFRCLIPSSYFTWKLSADSCTVELYYNTSNSVNAVVTVITTGNIVFTETDALSGSADTKRFACFNELTWTNIESKPATATRWPSWGEVTGKPDAYPIATKLQTARMLWGQPFDGTSNVNGHITMNDEYTLKAYMPRKKEGSGGWEYRPFMILDAANNDFAHIGVYGDNNILNFIYIGSNLYNSNNNLRIYPDGKVYTGGNMEAIKFVSNVTTGTSPLSVSSTTLCSNLNTDLLDGFHYNSFVPKSSYDYSNGTTVITSVKLSYNKMLQFHITGNSYGNYGGLSIDTYVQCYSYNSSTFKYHPALLNNGARIPYVTVFYYNSVVCLYIPNGGNFISLDVYCQDTMGGSGTNLVTDIVNKDLRSSGSYALQINPNNSAMTTDNVSSATKLLTVRTIWGQNFDGTTNVSGTLTGVSGITFTSNRTTYDSYGNPKLGDTATDWTVYNKNTVALLKVASNGNVSIGTTSSSYKLHVVGDIFTTTGFKKNGSSDSYVLLGGGGHKLISDFATAAQGIGTVISINKSLTPTTSWVDTGIKTDSTTFPEGNGSYIVQISVPSSSGTDGWGDLYTGYFSLFTRTNSSTEDEILLHGASHSLVKRIYLKTKATASTDGTMHFYIASEKAFSAARNINFKFRKLI